MPRSFRRALPAGRLCPRGEEAPGAAAQAQGAGHPGAVRARPRHGRRRVPRAHQEVGIEGRAPGGAAPPACRERAVALSRKTQRCWRREGCGDRVVVQHGKRMGKAGVMTKGRQLGQHATPLCRGVVRGAHRIAAHTVLVPVAATLLPRRVQSCSDAAWQIGFQGPD